MVPEALQKGILGVTQMVTQVNQVGATSAEMINAEGRAESWKRSSPPVTGKRTK